MISAINSIHILFYFNLCLVNSFFFHKDFDSLGYSISKCLLINQLHNSVLQQPRLDDPGGLVCSAVADYSLIATKKGLTLALLALELKETTKMIVFHAIRSLV